MPGLYEDDDEYGTDEQSGPKGLRTKLASVEKEKAALEKQLKELTESNATLTKQVKSTTLRQALTDAGVDPKYARFAERDEVEATPESVAKWVEESKDVYAFLAAKPAATPTGDADDDSADDGPTDELDPAFVEQILAGQQAETSGRPSGSSTIHDVLSGIDPSKFKTEQELDSFLRKLGAPTAGS